MKPARAHMDHRDPLNTKRPVAQARDSVSVTPKMKRILIILSAAMMALSIAQPVRAQDEVIDLGTISESAKAGILQQIRLCWSLGSASSAAMRTSVTVQFSLEAGGSLDAGSIQMTDYSGGTAQDAEVIYRAGRSALVRCNNAGNRQGYDVPAEQFQTRRDLQLVFDPSQMALR